MNRSTSLRIVPFLEKDPDRIFSGIKKYPEADGFEVWIDQFESLNEQIIERFCRKFKKISSKKLLIACKERSEQGSFKGVRKEKKRILLSAARGGADMLDISNLRLDLKAKSVLIASYHNFKKTPSKETLRKKILQLKKTGAAIVKIACKVNVLKDNETLMNLALECQRKKQRHIVIGMGEKGMITRILSDQIGNEITFVSGEKKSAEGQMTGEEFSKIRKIFL